MTFQPNHYEALGLPPTATAAQIKRKYRELARLYHPDVNSSPGAAQKILSINQAYRVLGDPERRSVYDAERALRPSKSTSGRSSAAAANSSRPSKAGSSPSRRSSAQPSNGRGRPYYDGFGRAYSSPKPKPERQAPAPQGAGQQRQMPDAQETSIERLLTEAKLAFINRDFQKAQRMCQQVLRIDARDGVAHEILGDVYQRQGNTQRASTYFAYAIQFNPRNRTAQAKLERLMGNVPVRPGAAPITYTRQSFHRTSPNPTSSTALAMVTLMATGLLLATPFLLYANPGNTAQDAQSALFGLSFNLVGAMAAAGSASGLLLAFYGRMRPFRDELGSGSSDVGNRSPVPMVAILGLSAIVWFYGSFLIYIGIAATRNRFSPSRLRAYAVTLALVCLLSLVYRTGSTGLGWSPTMLGGNVLFPAVLFGWLLGDAFRLRGRM